MGVLSLAPLVSLYHERLAVAVAGLHQLEQVVRAGVGREELDAVTAPGLGEEGAPIIS